MNYIQKGNDIIIWQNDFNLDETLDCGQAFRWRKIDSDFDCSYTGFFLNQPLTISTKDGQFIFITPQNKISLIYGWIILILKLIIAK